MTNFCLGCHKLEVHLGEISAKAMLLVTPHEAVTPDHWDGTSRDWAVTAQLYSPRSARHWGIGDFADLGVLTRRRRVRASAAGLSPLHALFPAEPDHPALAAVKLIAEPWDCGPGGYQIGGFPPGWGEWNDKFRDTRVTSGAAKGRQVRWPPGFRTRAIASTIAAASRGPASTSSPPMTGHVNDLVTYNEKHNEANGERQLRQQVVELRRGGADRARIERSMRCELDPENETVG
jgi:hypothetical protein